MTKYVVIEFGEKEWVALRLPAEQTPKPVFRIIDSETDTAQDGYRSIFEARKTADIIEPTPELLSSLLYAFYDEYTG